MGVLLVFTLSLASIFVPGELLQSTGSFAAKYTVTIERPETHVMHVEAVFSAPPTPLRLRILVPGTLTYQISMGPDETITYPFHVANIEVSDEQGESLPFDWNPQPDQVSYLVIYPGSAGEVHLSYDVVVLRPGGVYIGWETVQSQAYLGEDYGVIVPEAALFLPTEVSEVTVHFDLPQGWRPVAEGRRVDERTYILDISPVRWCSNVEGCISYIAVGPFDVYHVPVYGVDLTVAIQHGTSIPVAEMLDLSKKSFIYFSETFGPYQASDQFLVIFVEDESDGSCFHGILFSPRLGNSNVHNYAGHSRSCYPIWNMLVPDEMIYLWIEQMGVYGHPFDDAIWLIQSMSETFYLATVRFGYASEAEYYERILSDWEVYQSDLRAAGLENSQVILADPNTDLVVGKAGLVTAMLREEIVEATHGEKDFDDLLTMVVVPNPTGFTNGDILNALKELTGKDFTEFFQNFSFR